MSLLRATAICHSATLSQLPFCYIRTSCHPATFSQLLICPATFSQFSFCKQSNQLPFYNIRTSRHFATFESVANLQHLSRLPFCYIQPVFNLPYSASCQSITYRTASNLPYSATCELPYSAILQHSNQLSFCNIGISCQSATLEPVAIPLHSASCRRCRSVRRHTPPHHQSSVIPMATAGITPETTQ